ncbi:MAG: electron transfer flavoprotein subunit alpha/FixB family protein [Candidatus Heimdallarchaeota archaeon]
MGNNTEKGIWVFSENKTLALELLGKGRELTEKLQHDLIGVLIGADQKAHAQTLIDYGADIVHVVDTPSLTQFSAEPYIQVLTYLVETYKPLVLLIGATKLGHELAARIAIRAGTGCVAYCLGLDLNSENQLIMEREVYGGRAIASEVCRMSPKIASVRPKTFSPRERESRTGKIIKDTVELEESKSKLIELKKKEGGVESLTDATVVVIGGRGIQKKEDYHLLEELATVLRGRVGWTRPVVEDLKWFPGTEWVGLSGQKIAPKLYISAGVSGAIQHLAGIRGSKIIVAINSDPNAPIFEAADYGIVRNLYEIIPAFIEALKKRLN